MTQSVLTLQNSRGGLHSTTTVELHCIHVSAHETLEYVLPRHSPEINSDDQSLQINWPPAVNSSATLIRAHLQRRRGLRESRDVTSTCVGISIGRVTKSQGEGAIGGFLSHWHCMHCTA